MLRSLSLRAPLDLLYLLCCVLLTADVLVPEIFGNGKTKDYALWYWAGQQVLHGGPLSPSEMGRPFEFIYPRELEELLFKHPKVGEVAVIGVPHEKWGEEVAAFIRPAPGAIIEKEELIDYMRASLAPHKTPKHWFVVDAFPLTGSGKIQKFKLREAWSKGEITAI